LSLAIGKKGQNVRLGAKLLGWRIDIKSEEEKRQEVESQMAALVVPGAPVSVLLDHGLAEAVIDKLMTGGINTVEKLGSMTPEQLDEMGMDNDMVENLQSAVNGYYGQFENSMDGATEEVGAEVATDEVAAEAVATGDTAEANVETPAEANVEVIEEQKSSEEKSELENESVRIESTERPDEGEVRPV
jgi:N utilization substance protein A